MVKKLSQRQVSVFVAEKFAEAIKPFERMSAEQRERAILDYLARKAESEAVPEHIKLIRRIGIGTADPLPEYDDDDVRKLIEARKLIERDRRSPGDFVSKATFAAGVANGEGRQPSTYADEIRKEAKRLGYFAEKPYSRNTGKILDDIVKNLHLDGERPGTSQASWRKTLKRILSPSA
jgi:hypothetical protein